MKITHLELDRLRARLLPQSAHSEQDRDLTYRAMHLIAEHLLAGGQSAVLDATTAVLSSAPNFGNFRQIPAVVCY